jgi:hypothetical protein
LDRDVEWPGREVKGLGKRLVSKSGRKWLRYIIELREKSLTECGIKQSDVGKVISKGKGKGKGKVKVKLALQHYMKAQRQSRCVTLQFL